jgi:polysaccharide biosynthesis protein PslG
MVHIIGRSSPGRRRNLLIVLGVLIVVLAVAVAALTVSFARHVPHPSTTSAKSVAVVPAATVHVAATFPGWFVSNPSDTGSSFSAEHGVSKYGNIALRIDSSTPASAENRLSLAQLIPVRPLTTYRFSAWVRASSSAKSNAAIFMGQTKITRFSFPAKPAAWTRVAWSYRTPAKATQLQLRLASVGPTTNFLLDGLSVRAPGKLGIKNGSFEAYAAPTEITNPSLIMTTGTAYVGVSWRTQRANWEITGSGGGTIAHGTLKPADGLGIISLSRLVQGYYTVTVLGAGATSPPLQTAFIVLDRPKEGAPSTDPRFGVSAHIGIPQDEDIATVVPELGLQTVRDIDYWQNVELQKGKYTFPAWQKLAYGQLASVGVSVLPVPYGASPFYDNNLTPSTSAGIQAFAEYSQALVKQYALPAVEVYNEYNNPPMSNSKCGLTPVCYLPLVKSVYQAVKAQNPATIVVGPGIARYDDAWLTNFYKAGGLNYVDAVSFHPYDYSFTIGPEFLDSSLQQANASIKQYNNGVSKPIWITELGWSTATTDFSAQTQADNLVRAETISFANGVGKFFWYDLVDDGNNPADHESNFGLVDEATPSVPALAPKPAAMSQAVLVRKIAGKAYVSRDALGSTTYSYVFGTGSSATRVAWATTPGTVSFSATKPVTLTTELGQVSVLEPRDGQISVALTGEPVYLDGNLGAATPAG